MKNFVKLHYSTGGEVVFVNLANVFYIQPYEGYAIVYFSKGDSISVKLEPALLEEL